MEIYLISPKVEDKVLGTINIHHYLNENLLKTGGHIGYGVAPLERRKGKQI